MKIDDFRREALST